MLKALVRLSVRWRGLVLLAASVFAAVALHAFRSLPVQAFPDVTDPSVDVIATYSGQAAEDVERRVTLELERVLAGTPHMTNLRAASVFGLALLTLRFDDASAEKDNRAQVAARLRDARLPEGVEALLGPDSTPVGQIYRYTLSGPRSLRDLRALQDFVFERHLRSVPGVADVVTFGGFERQYQIRIDPVRIANFGVSVADVFQAIERTNSNAGGGYVGIGAQEFVVRGLGTMHDPSDIGDALVLAHDGMPVRVRDVAEVVEGSVPRRGAVGRNEEDETVEGIVLLRRGENPSLVLDALRAKMADLSASVLPKDVRVETFYDRGTLIDATLETVGKNLIEGALLVVIVLYVFLRTLRGALVVALVIPFALLAAFLGLKLLGLPANLISLGAIDFGILVDGSVVVLEATLLALGHAAPAATPADRRDVIADASGSVAKSVTFAMLVIIAGLLPTFTLERVEGRIFAPMAFTYVFALAGSLVAAVTLVPALEAGLLSRRFADVTPRWLEHLGRAHAWLLTHALAHRAAFVIAISAAGLALAASTLGLGTEFLPELNEGGLYITAVLPSSISLDETRSHVPDMRRRILALPEARDVLSHIGRPEEAAQIEGPNNVEFFVVLAPMREWRPGFDLHDLEREMRASLEQIPAVQYNFSQPITDRVYETISGIIGQVVVKVRGESLEAMTATAEQIRTTLAAVPGVADLSLYQAGESRQLLLDLDRDRLARFGLTVAEAQDTIDVALGGRVATELWEGERRYSVALRLPDAVRSDPDALGRLVIGSADRRVTLSEVADIRFTRGRAAIWREDLARFVAVKFNVRGRALGTVVAEAQRQVGQHVKVPEGLRLSWGGEFENQQRAMKRLAVAVPMALAAIVGLLYLTFRRARPAVLIAGTLPFAIAGSLAALRATGENFSVSAAVGCVALLGQVALAGVIVCARITGRPDTLARQRAVKGAGEALRPVLLTTTLAALGLVPAATSHAMGSETQRPFAIAIIGGLIAALPVLLVLVPLLFERPDGPRGTGASIALPRWRAAAVGSVVVALGLLVPARALASSPRDTDLLRRWLRAGKEVAVWRLQLGTARFDVLTASMLPNPAVTLTAGANVFGPAVNGERAVAAQLEVPLPIFGQIGARREAALRSLAVADVQTAALIWGRARDLRNAMLERAFAAARIRMLERNQSELREIDRIVGSRVSAGVSANYDARRVAVALATMRADAAASEVAEERAEAELVALLADPALTEAPIELDGLSPTEVGPNAPWLVEHALARRPDLELARRTALQRNAVAESARRDAWPVPALVLAPNASTIGGHVGLMFSGGISLPLPIFDRNQGDIGRARIEGEAQRTLAASLETRIRAEVARTVGAREKGLRELTAFRQSGVLATDELRERAVRAYQAGSFSVAELLDAFRASWEARHEELELARTVAEADIALSYVLGAVEPGVPVRSNATDSR